MEQSFNWLKNQNQCNVTTAALPTDSVVDWQHLPPLHPVPAALAALTPALQELSPTQHYAEAAQTISQGEEVWSLLDAEGLRSCEAMDPLAGCRHRR